MRQVPKATKGTGSNQYKKAEKDSTDVFSKTKTEVIHEAGFTPKQVERFQTLAAHPEIVEQAKAEAQATAENVLLFGVDVGEHLAEIPKATPDNAKKQIAPEDKLFSKAEAIADLGFTPRQARDLQTIERG